VGDNNDDPAAASQKVRRSIIAAMLATPDAPRCITTKRSRAPTTPAGS